MNPRLEMILLALALSFVVGLFCAGVGSLIDRLLNRWHSEE